MITNAILKDWIQHPEMLDRDTLYQLRTAMERYPYFSTLRLLYLKNLYLLHDDSFGSELRKSAIYVANRRILFQLVEGERFKIIDTEDEKSEIKDNEDLGLDRTLSLIDHFLEEKPKEEPKQQAAPINYATDYVAYLMQQEENNPGSENDDETKSHSDELIDGFITNNNGEFKIVPDQNENSSEPIGPKLDYSNDEDECLTETLAKIYIKQRRYSKALEIIRKLYLKNPKKNIYFADQIRFLEKLIINDKQK
jgi:tetratricopeptide (TPR) repeat protein